MSVFCKLKYDSCNYMFETAVTSTTCNGRGSMPITAALSRMANGNKTA